VESAREIADNVLNGRTTAVDVVQQTIERIEAVEPRIEAWVELDREGALRQARELDDAIGRGEQARPLAGVPVGIKDIVDVAGLPTRAGAPPFAHYTPERNARAVELLRRAGAIIMGKTHTTEFAYLDPAPTHNPWNLEHTPGGSSSGSGAAVGAGALPLAIGSQTVGSVLRPAGYCGAVGLKPSHGRISYAGTLPLAPSFDHLGVIARSVADAALALNALAGYDPNDPFSLNEPAEDYLAALESAPAPRIAIPRNYYHGTADDEVEAHLTDIARRFREAGARLADLTFPKTAPEVSDMAMPIMRREAAAAHLERFRQHSDEYRPNLRSLVESGLATSNDDLDRAREGVDDLRRLLVATFDEVDVLLLPVAPGPAPASLETTGPGIFCGPASFTGLPSIALPSGLAANGLPLAVQLVAGPRSEARLLAIARWAEKILDFKHQPSLA
jgi:aspartyl-tRNA(Asn)/glutamyl-tRNA(Gln) amidotransferase subunit A